MDFFAHLSLIEDPRSHVNRQHNLVDIMFLVMAAVVSGCEGWQKIEDFGTNKLDWLRKYRPFACGIPTRHSIARIIKGVKILWYYPNIYGGYVSFDEEGRLTGWNEP